MTARRLKIDGQPVLKLNIHDFGEEDVAFLDSLGIDRVDDDAPDCRFIEIFSQEDFLATRAAILTRYTVLAEKGPKVFLERKQHTP